MYNKQSELGFLLNFVNNNYCILYTNYERCKISNNFVGGTRFQADILNTKFEQTHNS